VKRQFLVTIDMPPDADVTEATEYIEEAVMCWRGGMDPQEPMADLDARSVLVKPLPRTKKRQID
jgi:hypothetical protein